MINSGYFRASLDWLTSWIYKRNREKSIIVKYEDLVLNTDKEIDRIIKFLFNRESTNEDKVAYKEISAEYVEQYPDNIIEDIYPRGYSGSVGIYEKYINRYNMDLIKKKLKEFKNESRYSDLLFEMYPNLYELIDEEKNEK